jgi:hypothetical protein
LLQRQELRRKREEEEAASTVELRAESWGLHDLLFTLVVSSRLVNILDAYLASFAKSVAIFL